MKEVPKQLEGISISGIITEYGQGKSMDQYVNINNHLI
jgi:hypothetical protein